MTTNRITRVNELLRRAIGDYLPRVIPPSEMDLSAVTITHVITTGDLRQARVLVSIRDHEGERERMLRRLRRHRHDFQQHINQTLTLRYTPVLRFELDESLERGDRILEMLLDMEREDEEKRAPQAAEQDAPADDGGTPSS